MKTNESELDPMKDAVSPSAKPVPLSGWALALDRTPVFLAVLTLFLLPFMLRADGAHPHLPQWIFLRITTFGLATAFVLQCVRYRRLIWLQAPFWIPLALLISWVLVADLFSPYPVVAFDSIVDGLLPFFWFALLFVLFREVWRVENLLMSFLAGALGLSALGLAQRLGWTDGFWKGATELDFKGLHLGGLENPDDLSGYYLVAWPLALALLLKAKNVFLRIWWGLTLASVLSALMWTGSRSSWIGLLAGVIVFTGILIIKQAVPVNAWRWSALGFLLFVLAVVPFTPAGKRLSQVFKPGDNGRLSHIQIWSGTWDMIQERPISGVGLGVFGTAFPSFRPASWALSQTASLHPGSHAQNLMLEWTAETGWIGLLLGVVFWIAVILPWWKLTWGNAIPRPLGAAAFSAFAGVLASSLFNSNSAQITTLCPLFFIAAMPAALSQRFHAVVGSPVRIWVKDVGKYFWLTCIIGTLVCALFAFQILEAFKSQAADLDLADAVKVSQTKNWNQAIAGYQQALQLRPRQLEAQYALACVYVERNESGDASQALGMLEQVGEVSPDFAWLHSGKRDAFNALGRTNDARHEWDRAVQLNPNLMLRDPRFIEAKQSETGGRFQESIRLLDILASEYPDQYWVWLDRAQCCVALHRLDDARHNLAKALAIWPESVDALLNLGYVANAQGDRSGLAFALKRLQAISPRDPRMKSLRDSVGVPPKDDI